MRSLPSIVLAVALSVAVYFVYKQLLNMNWRLDNMSQEIYYNISSIHDLNEKIALSAVAAKASAAVDPVSYKEVGLDDTIYPQDDIDSTQSFSIKDDALPQKSTPGSDEPPRISRVAKPKKKSQSQSQPQSSPQAQSQSSPQAQPSVICPSSV